MAGALRYYTAQRRKRNEIVRVLSYFITSKSVTEMQQLVRKVVVILILSVFKVFRVFINVRPVFRLNKNFIRISY